MAGTVLRKLSTRNSLSRCSDNHVRSFCALHINSQVPAGYPLEAAGPIFCAGITMWVSIGTSLSQFASGSCYWNNCSEVFLSFWSTAYTLILRFSPLCNWGVKDGGKRVGIVGIGGLGQMGVRWSLVDMITSESNTGATGEGDGKHSDCNLNFSQQGGCSQRDRGWQVSAYS